LKTKKQGVKLNSFIFDVDGTLTPSRGIIDPDFKIWFLDFCQSNRVYLVTGSDYPKTEEQLGKDVLDRIKLLFNCSGNEVYHKKSLIQSNIWIPDADVTDWLEKELRNSKFPLRTGNHIEKRAGTLNFSVLGRNCTLKERQLYIKWDEESRERERISLAFNHKFSDLEARIGGETGLDIFPKGKDKSQVLSLIPKEEKLYFFGDKNTPGGNDFPLALAIERQKRGTWYNVKHWQETFERLLILQEAKVIA